jgi:hypothetical protein
MKKTKRSQGNNSPFQGSIMAHSDKPLLLKIAPDRGFIYQ